MAFEPLEDRRLFSVALNAAGWTVVTPSSTARKVYVSSAHGNDKNSGLSASAPVASLAAATALVRSGTDDQLLLERGDTWTTSFPQWTKSGASATNPMLIGTYGTGNRPVINTGTGNGFIANSKSAVNHLVIQGLVFQANGRNPALGTVSAAAAAANPIGLELLGPSTDVTVEDSAFTYFGVNVNLQGGMGAVSDITIRRSDVSDSYSTSAHSEGLYAENMTGLTLDQDVFDHNGWNGSVAGATATNAYNHDIYAYSTVTGLTVTNSVISNASFAGIMARGGGVIDNDLFLNNGVGVVFGNANGATSTVGGVKGQVNDNVLLGDHAVGTTAFGEGVEIGNTAKGANVTVSGNVFAGDTQHNLAAITLTYANATTNPAAAVGLNNVTISDNVIYGWQIGINLGTFTDGGTGVASLNGLKVTGNQVSANTFDVWHQGAYSASAEAWSGNTYSSAWAATQWFYLGGNMATTNWKSKVESSAAFGAVSYVDPTRTAATFAASLGKGNTVDAFVAAATAQSDLGWSASLTAAAAIAYVKAGFTAKSPTASPAANPTPTPTATATGTTALTGTTIGTTGSYANAGNTAAKATDGNLSTFFDGPTASGDWVGLDLGSAKTVTAVAFAPRSGLASRMVGGVFQASSSATFSTGVTTLYTVSVAPATGSLTTVNLSVPTSARYVRYLAPANSYGNVAEVRFLTTAATAVTRLTGTTIGTAGSYANAGNTAAKATDGNLSTFFDGPTANGNWVGLDLGSAKTVKQVSFAPRSGFASRMVGGVFQVSTSANFTTGVTTVYTITAAPATGSLTTITLSTAATGRYVRYLSPNGSYGDVADVQFLG